MDRYFIMKKYLIIQNWDTDYPNFKTDIYGKPLFFTDLQEAMDNTTVNEKLIEIQIN